MLKTPPVSAQEAEVIALKALAFLASDPERLSRFLEITGIAPQTLRQSAAEPSFLAGVLDHLRADQSLLFMFAESERLPPDRVDRARQLLPGAASDF